MAIEKGVQKELHAIQVKRKSDDSSEDEDDEINMFDMSDFSSDDMNNLTIDDKTEVWDEGQDESQDKYMAQMTQEMFALDSVDEAKELEEFQNLHKKFLNLDLCIDASTEPELCSIADLIRGQPAKKKSNRPT